MDDEAFVRDRIRQAREDAGLSQRDIARLYGVSQSKVSDIERGRVQVSAGQLLEIATLLSKPITFFFPSASTNRELSKLEAELLDAFRALPSNWQMRVLGRAKSEARLYQYVQPYIRAGIPEDLYEVMRANVAFDLDVLEQMEEGTLPEGDEIAASHRKYMELQDRYVRWKREVDQRLDVDDEGRQNGESI